MQVRITVCTFAVANFFTGQISEVLGHRSNTKSRKAKVTVEKTLNRAGATPLFRPSAAQMLVGSLPPSGTVYRAPCFFHGERNVKSQKEKQHVDH
jgi:hypothetical protein